MADVFLSYAREDRARAEQIARGLEAAGVEVFWDNEIPPGQSWADYIESKLAQCKALVVLWSAESAKSQWVREEARLGRDKGVLIPAMLDNVTPPFGFGEVQAANLASWNGEQDHADWRRFVEAVTSFVGAAPRPQPAAAPQQRAAPPPPAPAKARKGLPVWLWVVGAVVLTLVVLGVIGSMVEDTPQQSASNTPVQPAAQQPQAPAGDQSPQQIILAQLQQAEAAAAQQGFQIVGQPASGGLQQGQSWNIPAELYAGYDYRVLGVCDRDCNDLDLVLFDANGAPVAQDTTTSSQPIVAVQPAYHGAFTIQVQMYNCTVAPCYYAVALYARPLQ